MRSHRRAARAPIFTAALFLIAFALRQDTTRAAPQTPPVQAAARADRTGAQLFAESCAACHGLDGRGTDPSTISLPVPVPDFSECTFATREPDADWIAIAHEGGPVRGFNRMMPSFAGALTTDEMQQIFGHIRTFCDDPSWPRGELNLPRAFATEKAYPEDEAVIAMAFEDGAVDTDLIYERRFGARNQIEFKLPIPSARFDDGWGSGFGDLAVGVKRAMYHSLARGSIFSVAGEIILPTGEADRDRGKGTAVFEPFVSFGQILPRDTFFQFQGGLELPFDETRAEREGFWRLAAGKTFAADRGYGRTWTPMLELVAARELESGATAHWDAIPQLQVSLNQRQHILLSAGMRLPINERAGRAKQFLIYVLWDWFDGGIFDGW